MVQALAKGPGGSVTRTFPFLATCVILVALVFGFLATPWLGFQSIQNYLFDMNFHVNSTSSTNNYVIEFARNVSEKKSPENNNVVNSSLEILENKDPDVVPQFVPVPSPAASNVPGNSVSSEKQQTIRNGSTNIAAESQELQKIRDCNLFQGRWVHDNLGPLYKFDSCPLITEAQNCQRNGRPDKEYENWRWQPSTCDLPRFDAEKFLQMMKGKTLAFVGDSVARNQMESMMCMLWQYEVPKNKGNKKMQRWYFPTYRVTVIRIWSSWLVHHSEEPFQFAPEGLTKLHLDVPDETFMEFLPTFDVVVLSSGHWFVKKAAFINKGNVVGGQSWWDKAHEKKVDSVEAFTIATRTALKAIASYPGFNGLTVLRTYSPDHYEGGTWNTGGSCTGRTRPHTDAELIANGFTDLMLSRQLQAFGEAKGTVSNASKMLLLNITSVFQYRADGHPGAYRSTDPNKKITAGRDGRPPPQDCLHWCMPGAVDTWNELLADIIRRNLNNKH